MMMAMGATRLLQGSEGLLGTLEIIIAQGGTDLLQELLQRVAVAVRRVS